MSIVLVIAPHPDDEVIGCGGTIQFHSKKGDAVFVHIVANRVINHVEDEKYIRETLEQSHEAAKLLGVKEIIFSNLRDEQLDVRLIDVIIPIEDIINRVNPDIVYVPNETDADQDHRAVSNACKIACRSIKKVLAYEVLGPTRGFTPNYYVDIESFLSCKVEALHFYKGEVFPFPHPRSIKAIESLARLRGVESGLLAAEAFKLLKEVVV